MHDPDATTMITFGPVQSRRLGRSIGVNNVPGPKHCTYSCPYCQAGPTANAGIERRTFHDVGEIADEVRRQLDTWRAGGEPIDIVSFVPEGEPTLDANLGAAIRAIHDLGAPVAVFTNSSLLWMPDVREELALADLVSVKVDSVDERAWRGVNAPNRRLDLRNILDGIRVFARAFDGRLFTETMLIAGVNDGDEAVAAVADFVAEIEPERAFLAVPTRPSADPRAIPPPRDTIARAFEIMMARVPYAELLASIDGGAYGKPGSRPEDLLAVVAVHPIRESALEAWLEETGVARDDVDALLRSGRLEKTLFEGEIFYRRGR